MSVTKITNISQLTTYLSGLETRLDRVEYENEHLREEINQLKLENQQLRQTAPTEPDDIDRGRFMRFLPQTGLLSHNFLTRAFAVWGHYFVAQLIIGMGVFAVYMVVVFVILAALRGR